MEGIFKVIYITGGQTDRDGKTYSNITVMQGDTVLKMSCDNTCFQMFADKQFKPVDIIVRLSEYSGDKSYKCVGVK